MKITAKDITFILKAQRLGATHVDFGLGSCPIEFVRDDSDYEVHEYVVITMPSGLPFFCEVT